MAAQTPGDRLTLEPVASSGGVNARLSSSGLRQTNVALIVFQLPLQLPVLRLAASPSIPRVGAASVPYVCCSAIPRPRLPVLKFVVSICVSSHVCLSPHRICLFVCLLLFPPASLFISPSPHQASQGKNQRCNSSPSALLLLPFSLPPSNSKWFSSFILPLRLIQLVLFTGSSLFFFYIYLFVMNICFFL